VTTEASKTTTNSSVELVIAPEDKGLEKVNQNSYSACGQQAIAFAKQRLQDNARFLNPSFLYKFTGVCGEDVFQPTNPVLGPLNDLRFEALVLFESCSKQDESLYFWNNSQVITLVNECLKISYALCSLALDDLPEYIQSVALQGLVWSPAKAIAKQKSYLLRIFPLVSDLYHHARGSAAWLPHVDFPNINFLQFPREPITKEHEDLFYQEGTIQSQWRELYNDFCDRVRLYIPKEDLKVICKKGDVRWLQKDEGPATFFRL
jgi:hypothetical protein